MQIDGDNVNRGGCKKCIGVCFKFKTNYGSDDCFNCGCEASLHDLVISSQPCVPTIGTKVFVSRTKLKATESQRTGVGGTAGEPRRRGRPRGSRNKTAEEKQRDAIAKKGRWTRSKSKMAWVEGGKQKFSWIRTFVCLCPTHCQVLAVVCSCVMLSRFGCGGCKGCTNGACWDCRSGTSVA